MVRRGRGDQNESVGRRKSRICTRMNKCNKKNEKRKRLREYQKRWKQKGKEHMTKYEKNKNWKRQK